MQSLNNYLNINLYQKFASSILWPVQIIASILQKFNVNLKIYIFINLSPTFFLKIFLQLLTKKKI